MKLRAWIAFIVLLGGLCCGVSGATESTSAETTEALLQKAAAKAQLDETRGMTFLQDPGLMIFLNSVIHRLWEHAHCGRAVVTIHVVQDAVDNAYTYPDGAIYLTTGLLACTRNEDQLALILSHEMIHYVRRHALAALKCVQSSTPLGGGDNRADLTALLEAAEQQADREGIELMRRAGYSAQKAVADAFQDVTGKKAESASVPATEPFAERMARVRHLLSQRSTEPHFPTEIEGRNYTLHIAPALLANARSAIQQGQWAEASQSVRRYLSVRSVDPRAYYLQGEIASRAGKRMEQAVSRYQKAIDLDPSFAPAYRALGYIYFKSGRLQRARGFFKTSLALAPHADENGYIREYLKRCGQ